MEEDDSNSNHFLNLAKVVEDVGGDVKQFLSTIKDDVTEISKKGMAEWITTVYSFHKVLSNVIKGTLKHAYETKKAKAIELQKEVADLKLAISDSNHKIKSIGEELKASEKKLTVSNNVIKDLENQRSTQDSLNNQMLQDIQTNKSLLESKIKQIDSQTEKICEFQEKLSLCAAEISERDNQITELNKKNKQFMSEISQLKSTHKAKEDNWTTDIAKLNMELDEKGLSVDDLNKKLDALMLEKNEVNAQLDTLRAEKCSRDNLIQEIETRLNSLQADHVGVLLSFENAQKATNELTHRVLELEKVVDNQKEVISFIGKEKKELEEKSESVVDLNKKLDALMLEKNEVNAQLETLRAEKCTQENLIQELEIRLNALQAEHVEVLTSFDNAQEVKNELTTKVVELENEMDRQNGVISDRTNEKMEAIRQLSSSLEHYRSRYEELCKAFRSKNTAPRCFNFLH